MTDAAGPEPGPLPSDHEHEQIMRRIEVSSRPIGRLIFGISIVAGAIALIVIVGVVYLSFNDKPVPAELSNWGGIILGFYFGQFVSLLKDYMGITRVEAIRRE